MTHPDKLTIEEAIAYKKLVEKNQDIHWSSAADILAQLADTMHENECLKKHPPFMVCNKCNHINTIHPYKDSDNVG